MGSSAAGPARSSAPGNNPEPVQFLTFLLDDRQYGVELHRIQEIRGYTTLTPIPNIPAYIRGVMNLRGTILPVVDLRMIFGLPQVEYDKFTVIVIATVAGKMVGLLVDAVSDVLVVAAEAIRAAPEFGPNIDTRFISGVFPARDRLALGLDLEKLLTASDLVLPEAA